VAVPGNRRYWLTKAFARWNEVNSGLTAPDKEIEFPVFSFVFFPSRQRAAPGARSRHILLNR
jgi:hypothetical protein